MSNEQANLQALCCDCGTLRLIGAKHPGQTGDDPGGETQTAWMIKRGMDPLSRCICRARCATCAGVTIHAYLRLDSFRDHLEKHIYGTAEGCGH
jgi:hypothetical protein